KAPQPNPHHLGWTGQGASFRRNNPPSLTSLDYTDSSTSSGTSPAFRGTAIIPPGLPLPPRGG
ncbi:MAG: hypothetical protein KA117_11560, partial [Verrucomicrobia bacterium]|nr:hypothetical protein [Verrucomicrobiota bacterium]MBP8015920.1 hypothetical protein [Verrucomicrobiota bacterium]HNZ76284.1 hypothetical protein [Verrucomicrobiota bacterium]HOC51214.1 hypothetical protein [Verrucomicrobiota bacterium]HOH40615.1 hypothetical protein [Verrucomicrobiota bacterium]